MFDSNTEGDQTILSSRNFDDGAAHHSTWEPVRADDTKAEEVATRGTNKIDQYH
jgi:hypothetical protein